MISSVSFDSIKSGYPVHLENRNNKDMNEIVVFTKS